MSEIELKFKIKKKLDSKPSGEEGSSMEEIFYFKKKSKIHETNKKA